VIKPKRSDGKGGTQSHEYLEKLGINTFLKWAQTKQPANMIKHRTIEKIAVLCDQLMSAEAALLDMSHVVESKQDLVDHLGKKCQFVQERLAAEEEAKRKTLIRYVHEVKSQENVHAPMNHSAGLSLKLPESGIGDEEVHAIAALLRHNRSITELQLQSNTISSEGARAIAAILANATSGLKHIDLRKNRIGDDGVRVLAEALERNPRMKHVYVHAGGKIEALGATTNQNNPGQVGKAR
jgi:hypothetical protein